MEPPYMLNVCRFKENLPWQIKGFFIVIDIYNKVFVLQRDITTKTVSKLAQNVPEYVQVDIEMAL